MMGSTGTVKVDFIGPELKRDAYVAVAGVGKYVYGLPSDAGRAIQIDTSTGDVRRVGPEVVGRGSYLTAVVVDDHIYGIPCDAAHVMRINGSTGEVDLIGPEMQGVSKYLCACALGKRIYAVPCDAQQVLRIDCSTGGVSLVGPMLGDGEFKYWAAVAADGGIYAPPSCARQVLRIRLDGDAERVELIGPDLSDQQLKYWCAAALGQHIYAPPGDAQRVLRITPGTGECSVVGPDIQGEGDESQYMSAAVVGGRIYGVPAKISTESKNILRIDGGSGHVDFVGPEFEQGGDYYASAVVGRCVYVLPYESFSHMLIINDGNGRVDRERLGSSGFSFSRAAVLHGRVYALPRMPGRILRLTPPLLQRTINRWGLDIANVLAGSHQPFPDGFVPEHNAHDCLDYVEFADKSEVVQKSRGAAAVMPVWKKRGEFMVIYAFTMESSLVRQVTAAMRHLDAGRLQNWREYIYHLEKALLRQPRFEGIAFRGLDTLITEKVYQPGTKITWQSFSSATQRPEVLVEQRFVNVYNFNKLNGTIFVIQAWNAWRVDHISEIPNEYEVVFRPNTHFEVQAMITDTRTKHQLLPGLEMYNLENLVVFQMEED